ncbi:GMC oxidoreductase [Subtercola frigoramans]|uniref:Choline dehydrogenase-like flavoprotein n=1 Tax=Subtercola frigoramans TaxID=120298 RepID=A0ABS2L1Z9_9MICO|nr:GMC oxidoreductase [Subtercola frigoramans]MBM7471115.1 choline dehydrogenase-like flavoprotein [Subtercola frigoramans]
MRTTQADVLIVGSGLMGAALAEQLRQSAPQSRIVMVDGGSVIGSVPGQHLHDTAEPTVRDEYIQAASPGVQSLYLGAAVTPDIGGDVKGIRPGMYNVSAFESDATDMPASALAWNVGGMGIHWTAATPWPWGDEVFAYTGEGEWAGELRKAQELLHVEKQPFAPTEVGTRMLGVLDGLFGPVSAPGRHPQAMPMAVKRQDSGPMPRTGPNRIFPRMKEPAGDDFTLVPGTLAVEIVHDGSHARGARVREIDSGEEYVIEAVTTVVAADTLRTPQLLFASGIRPWALGRFLNEHAFLTGQVTADLDRLDIPLESIPRPMTGEWLIGSYWLPHSGRPQPFHGQIMDRLFIDESGGPLAYSVGLSWYVPTSISEHNRLEFDEAVLDAAGLPRTRIHYAYTADDEGLFSQARASQLEAGLALGDFRPERDSARLSPGSSLHFTGTARSGPSDDGTSVCDPHGRVWGFDNLFLAGGAVIPTAVVGNSTLTGMVTAVRAGREIIRTLSA